MQKMQSHPNQAILRRCISTFYKIAIPAVTKTFQARSQDLLPPTNRPLNQALIKMSHSSFIGFRQRQLESDFFNLLTRAKQAAGNTNQRKHFSSSICLFWKMSGLLRFSLFSVLSQIKRRRLLRSLEAVQVCNVLTDNFTRVLCAFRSVLYFVCLIILIIEVFCAMPLPLIKLVDSEQIHKTCS